MTSRRSFLAALGAVALDPERLLWVPGAKLISIPAPRPPGRMKFPPWVWYTDEYVKVTTATLLEIDQMLAARDRRIPPTTMTIRRPARFNGGVRQQ